MIRLGTFCFKVTLKKIFSSSPAESNPDVASIAFTSAPPIPLRSSQTTSASLESRKLPELSPSRRTTGASPRLSRSRSTNENSIHPLIAFNSLQGTPNLICNCDNDASLIINRIMSATYHLLLAISEILPKKRSLQKYCNSSFLESWLNAFCNSVLATFMLQLLT